MLLSPGDSVVVEQFVYSGTLAAMTPYQPHYLTVESDGEGMVPASLAAILAQHPADHPRRPKFIYINPTGANPTGTVLPLDRRREIYSLVCKHDLVSLNSTPTKYIYVS